ncbi:Arc family DNA-binding protein (plasmid) [Pseudomonas amygdali pv. lachrymans]|uniref:Arc family DNA-binding protein n=2 Tax=Pseudomonas amygdali TaxID=47877 RepID=UPI0006B9050D|nr:Arc family DNA-binding protein [Pseudomonas amygdali]RMM39264.1 hypothetical protein ALQ79_200482 [Pseudomonas amygdali pv. lachrymans]WIO61570.1 Arc family DNA-binding protein [Pseudomonas amygdali pv. lachrymans]
MGSADNAGCLIYYRPEPDTMISSTSLTSTPDSAFPAAPSRTAEKFVLRIPIVLKEAIEEVARSQFRSFNSEVALAVISQFESHRRLITMRNSLAIRLGAEVADEVLSKLRRINPEDGDVQGFNVRFPEGLRDEVKTSSADTMKIAIANACADWVYYSQQIEGLLKRCEDPDIQFPSKVVKH